MRPFPSHSAPLPTTGIFTNSHATSLRVRYCECDPMGVAHHASYLPWLEIGRTELLRQSGVSYAQLEASGIFLVIVKVEVRYRKPIRYDDLIEIRTSWVGGSRVKIEHEYELSVLESGTPTLPQAAEPSATPFIAAAATTTLGCVGREGKICELPTWLVRAKNPTQF